MDELNLEGWDEKYYKELNTYFKIRIEQMLLTDSELQEQMQQKSDFQLRDLVAYFPEEDQDRWEDFMRLDRMKMQLDMWNHLHGKGTRFKPGQGFVDPDNDTNW